MAKPKQLNLPEETLEELLDTVSNVREELIAIERTIDPPAEPGDPGDAAGGPGITFLNQSCWFVA
jgi:hypothetical protein